MSINVTPSQLAHLVLVQLVSESLELLLGLLVDLGVLLCAGELRNPLLLALVVGGTLGFSPLLESAIERVSIDTPVI